MPYDTPYNRRIAAQQQKTDSEYADYRAYSNQNYLSDGSMGDARGNIRLFPKAVQADIPSPLDYSGGITHRNMEGDGGGPLRKQFNAIALGEDTRRHHNKSAAYAPVAPPMGSGRWMDRDLYSSESEDESESKETETRFRKAKSAEENMSSSEESSSAESSSEDEEMEGGSDHKAILKKLKHLPLSVQKEVKEWLAEMKGAGRGAEAGAGIMDWLKSAASSAGDLIKKNIKPLAKLAAPLLKKIPGVGPALEKAVAVAKKVPGAADVLGEYGLGMQRGGAVAIMPAPESGLALSDVPLRPVGGKRKRKVAATASGELETTENPLIGVPMRKPGYMKSTGLHFNGASLGAGASGGKKRGRPRKVAVEGGSVMGGPSNDPVNRGKITGGRRRRGVIGKGDSEEDAELAEIFDKKMKLIKPIYSKPAAARSSVAVPKSPEEKRKREESPKEKPAKKGKGKTGSALFKQKGSFPLDVKAGVPETPMEEITGDKEFGAGRKKAKKGGMLKTLMPGSTLSGCGKKSSPWIEHCKAYAKAHSCSYKDAMKAAKASYKK